MGITNEAAKVYLRKADENFKAAKFLFQAGYINAAFTRAYYSSFQIVYQKMLRDDIVAVDEHFEFHLKALFFLGSKATQSYHKFVELQGFRVKADYRALSIPPEEYRDREGKFSSLFQELKDIFAYDIH